MNVQNNHPLVFPLLDSKLNIFSNEFRSNYLCIQNPQFRDVEKINLIAYDFFVKHFYVHAKVCYEKSLNLDNNQIEPLLNYAELIYFEYIQNKNRLKSKYMNDFKDVLKKLSSQNSIDSHQIEAKDIIKEIDCYLSGNCNNYSFIKLILDVDKLFNKISSSHDKIFICHFTWVHSALVETSRSRFKDISKLKDEFFLIQCQLKLDLIKLEKDEIFIRSIVNKAMDLKISFSDFISKSEEDIWF